MKQPIGTRIGKRAVYLADALVDMIVFIIIILLLLFGLYALWDSHMVYSEAGASNYTQYKPTEDIYNPGFYDFAAENPDIRAWLTIYGTHIDYPIVQGEDNMKYVNTDALGNYSMTGSLFLDCDNSPDFSDFNSIIFGHHMDRNAMFGEIASFRDKSFFDEHEYGDLYYDHKHYGVHFYEFMEVDAYDSTIYAVGISEDDKKQKYLDYLDTKAVNSRNIGTTISDRVLLLSTCTNDSTNGRHILIGIITDETYADPYPEVEESGTYIGLQTLGSKMSDFIAKGLSMWLFLLLLILILLWLICEFFRRRRYNKRNRHIEETDSEDKHEA